MKNILKNNLLLALCICITQNVYAIIFELKENGYRVGEYDSNTEKWISFACPEKPDSIKLATPLVVNNVLSNLGGLYEVANSFEYPPQTMPITFSSIDINDDWMVYFSGAVTVLGNESMGDGRIHIHISIFVQDDDYTFHLQGTYINNPHLTPETHSCRCEADSTTY